MRNDITVDSQIFRVGERVRVGQHAGALVAIYDFDLVTLDAGEELDDGCDDGFSEVHPLQLTKLAADEGVVMTNTLLVTSNALDRDDFALLLTAIDALERSIRIEFNKGFNNTTQSAIMSSWSRLLVLRGKLHRMQEAL